MAGRRTCTCSNGQQDVEQHAEHANRRAVLAAILSVGLAGQAQAKVTPPPAKKDAYQVSWLGMLYAEVLFLGCYRM